MDRMAAKGDPLPLRRRAGRMAVGLHAPTCANGRRYRLMRPSGVRLICKRCVTPVRP